MCVITSYSIHYTKLYDTANRLQELKLIDNVVPEPLGGAHRDMPAMAAQLKERLLTSYNFV